MRRRLLRTLLSQAFGAGTGALVVAGIWATPVVAQVAHRAALGPVPARAVPAAALPDEPRFAATATISLPGAGGQRRAPWYAPVTALVVPGSGQLLLGQQRGVGYLVLEGYLLLQASSAQRSGNRDRTAYRQLAVDVSRAAFGGSQPGPWSYYEAMEEHLESGRFDRVPGGAIDPETDVTTYNGLQWLLARETFWANAQVPPAPGSPEYERALAFYERRAIRDGFRWSWRDAQLQQDVYRQTIANANANYQRAVNLVGAVAANHLLAMVDAFVTVRLRRFADDGGAAGGGAAFESLLDVVDSPEGATLRPTVRLRLPLPSTRR